MTHPFTSDPLPAGWIRPVRRLPRGGRRSGVLADFQLTCSTSGYDVEILARETERPRGIEIAGQVTSADDPHVPAAGVRVALLSDPAGPVLDEIRTNAFGEFTFDHRPGRTFGLRLGDDPLTPTVLVWEPDL